MSRSSLVVAAVAAALVTVPASLPAHAASKDSGSLKVVAAGVPAGRYAKIVVAGKDYRKKITSAGKLRNLRPGNYRVWATPIVVDGGTAAVPDLPVRVKVRKKSKATLRLSYLWNPRTDSYPPGPASGLQMTERTVSSVALRWQNGAAPDLAEVAVRRKVGNTAPKALDDGRVVPLAGLADDVTDTGLRPNTVYSYSVFMVDRAGNASAPVSLTVRSKGQAASIAAGLAHTCALLTDPASGAEVDTAAVDNQVACWGANDSGQLGDGTLVDSSSVRTVQLSSPIAVVAGASHTCALVKSGDVWCWGANEHGQLGDGSGRDSRTPVAADVSDIVAIAAGHSHTCAVDHRGDVWCWGANDAGQLGRNPSERERKPAVVAGLPPATSVTAGYGHTCAVSDAEVWCWGANDSGQLGNGSNAGTSTPDKVSLGPVQAISAGVGHTCADERSGAVKCWGSNQFGQLGDGTTTDRSTPVVAGVRDVVQLSAGAYHTCAISGAQSRCWGRNSTGRIGDGTVVDRWSPVRVNGLQQATGIAAGGYHSCAVTASETLCWGANGRGQLGSGDLLASSRPVGVDGL